MRERYVRHFLHHVIELSDGLGIYYVQDCFCDRSAFFGVELKTFFDHRQTVQWLRDCIAYDRCGIYNLRSFLVQSAPRRYRVHRMDNHRVMDEVARVIVDYDYPVVIRPWFEPPWRASNTIDVICAIRNGAPLSVISRSPELDNAAKMLETEAKKHKQGAAQSFHQNLLALNDIDPNDVDTARSPWNVEQWKQDHQLRLAARREALLPHSPKGWDDPDAARKVMANVIKILASTTRQILQHPIDSLIIEPIKEFAGMFQSPKVDPHREPARHDVLGWYYQSKDIDPNDLDTADHPNRPMQWADSYNKRHRKDRNPVGIRIPPPEDTEKILAMLFTYVIARKYGKAIKSGSEALAEESVQTVKRPSKSSAANKGMPEVENPKPLEKLENKVNKEYSYPEKAGGPKKTTSKSASELYDEIRRSKTDVNDIAKNYNLKPERLQKIKEYVFDNPKFNRNDKSTAEAWLRLAEGKGSAHDKFLLKHETVEMFYNDMKKAKPGLYDDKFGDLSTHDVTNYTGYDWEQGFTKRGPRQEM